MLLVPDRLTLWLAWIALASAFFTAVPLGPFGLLGWLGAVGPLLHRVVPSIGARRIALIGLGSIALLGLTGTGIAWYEPFVAAGVFLFGLLLAPVPITGYEDPRQKAIGNETEEAMTLALTREIGRARRYDRPLALISASCDRSEYLRELEAAFTSEMHIYAQTFLLDGRLMIVVPELDETAYKSLKQRVLKAAEARNLRSVTLGVVFFPSGECTVSGMLDIAQSDCKLFKLGRTEGSAHNGSEPEFSGTDASGVDGGLSGR